MKVIATSFLFIIISSCFGQQQKEFSLEIINRSSITIDSIVIPVNNLKLAPIDSGSKREVKFALPKLKSNSEGHLPMYIYKGGKQFKFFWGFHDWGQFGKTTESIYVFNNGIAREDSLHKPEEFELILINKASLKIDSIKVEPGVLIKQVIEPGYSKLILNFDEFSNNPTIIVYQQKPYKIKIEHDWDNWNFNQRFYTLFDNGRITL